MLSCSKVELYNSTMGTWGWTFCFYRFLWVVLGLDADGRDAGLGNGALGLQCVLSHQLRDTVNCSHWPFDFLTFLQTFLAPFTLLDLVILFLQTELKTHHASMNMTKVPIQGWTRKDFSHSRKRWDCHQFEKPPGLSWPSEGPVWWFTMCEGAVLTLPIDWHISWTTGMIGHHCIVAASKTQIF